MKVIELLLIAIFVAVFLFPSVFSRYARSVVGKLVLVLTVVALGLTYGVKSAVIMTCIAILLFEARVREGMENEEEGEEKHEEKPEEEKKDEPVKDRISAEEDLKPKEERASKNDPSANVEKKDPKVLPSSKSVENFANY